MVRARNVGRYTPDVPTPDWEQEEFESRTQIRDAAKAVTIMGERLASLTEKEIRSLKMPETLEDAIIMLKGMTKGPALKRQKLFVGKWLRSHEDIITDIKTKIEMIEIRAKQQNGHFQRLERWRDRLILEGDDALTEFMLEFTHADRSQLRQWVRNAQKEASQDKPAKSSKLIFKYLRGLEW